MRKFLCFLLLLCLVPGFCAAQDFSRFGGGASDLPATEDWQPPVIDEAAAKDAPWLWVLKIAQEEIGYIEGPLNDESKYGAWFSGGGRPAWCAEFLTWCVNESDTRYGTDFMRKVYPWYGGTKEGYPWFVERGTFISDNGQLPTREKQWLIGSDHYLEDNEYVPQPGDYMWIWYHSRKQGPEHVCIVEGVSRNADGSLCVHVIEGNNPDRVQRAEYDLDYKLIYGFGTPVKRACRNIRVYNSGDEVDAFLNDFEKLGWYTPSAKKGGTSRSQRNS
jgi:hypothetical protein